jgi:hypothetical protein
MVLSVFALLSLFSLRGQHDRAKQRDRIPGSARVGAQTERLAPRLPPRWCSSET